jgi:hypothetical protein
MPRSQINAIIILNQLLEALIGNQYQAMTETYPFEISMKYETSLFRRAAIAYIKSMVLRNKRIVGSLLLFAAILILILLVLLGMILIKGCPLPHLGYPIQLLLVVVVALAVMVPLLYLFLYFRTVQNCEKLARKMSDTNIYMAFGRDYFKFQSELAHSEISWKLFYKLQTGPDIWLLFPNPMTFYMLPTEVLSTELQGFILERLRENGIAIKET